MVERSIALLLHIVRATTFTEIQCNSKCWPSRKAQPIISIESLQRHTSAQHRTTSGSKSQSARRTPNEAEVDYCSTAGSCIMCHVTRSFVQELINVCPSNNMHQHFLDLLSTVNSGTQGKPSGKRPPISQLPGHRILASKYRLKNRSNMSSQ